MVMVMMVMMMVLAYHIGVHDCIHHVLWWVDQSWLIVDLLRRQAGGLVVVVLVVVVVVVGAAASFLALHGVTTPSSLAASVQEEVWYGNG